MSKRTYYPERGDLIHLSMDPSTGRELAGPHFALVLSPKEYNRASGLLVAVPITSKHHQSPFQLPLPANVKKGSGQELGGWVYADQIKSFDWRERNAVYVATAPPVFTEEVIDLTLTLIDPKLR